MTCGIVQRSFGLTTLPVIQNNTETSMRKITRALSKNNLDAAQRDSGEGVFLCGFLGVLERKISCSVMGW